MTAKSKTGTLRMSDLKAQDELVDYGFEAFYQNLLTLHRPTLLHVAFGHWFPRETHVVDLSKQSDEDAFELFRQRLRQKDEDKKANLIKG